MLIERISNPDDKREARPISGMPPIGWLGILNAEGTALAYSTDSWREANSWMPARVEVDQHKIYIEADGEMVTIPLPENVQAFKSYGGVRFEVATPLPNGEVKIRSKLNLGVTVVVGERRTIGDPYLWRRYNATEGTRIDYGVSHWEYAPDQAERHQADVTLFLITPKQWGVRVSHQGVSHCISLPDDIRPTVHPHHVTFEYRVRP